MNENARRAYAGYAVLAALVAFLIRAGGQIPDPSQGGEQSDPTSDPGSDPSDEPGDDPLGITDPSPTPAPSPTPDDSPIWDPDPDPAPTPDPAPAPTAPESDIDWSDRDSGTAAPDPDPVSVDLPTIGTSPSPNPETYTDQDVENAVKGALVATGAIATAGSGLLAGGGVQIGRQALASGSLALPSSVASDVDSAELSGEIRQRLGIESESESASGPDAALATFYSEGGGWGDVAGVGGFDDAIDRWGYSDVRSAIRSAPGADSGDVSWFSGQFGTDVDTSSGIDWSERDSGTAADTSDPGSDDDDDGTTWAWDSGGYDSGTAADTDTSDPGSDDSDDDHDPFGDRPIFG